MHASSGPQRQIAPSTSTASVLAALFVYECDRDTPHVAIPRVESHLVVRFGPSARAGLDVHAFGVRRRAQRKLIRRGQQTVTARLRLGAQEAVLGVPASAIAGRIVPLEDLWGEAATRQLVDRLASASDTVDAAAILEGTIAEHLAAAQGSPTPAQLALDAAQRLTRASVNAVAVDLGVSERHLRRVFREAIGVSPKTFAKLVRFQHALSAARDDHHASWASIAASAGYYDQAHLIAEFREFAGVTPHALLHELRGAPLAG